MMMTDDCCQRLANHVMLNGVLSPYACILYEYYIYIIHTYTFADSSSVGINDRETVFKLQSTFHVMNESCHVRTECLFAAPRCNYVIPVYINHYYVRTSDVAILPTCNYAHVFQTDTFSLCERITICPMENKLSREMPYRILNNCV